MALSVLMFQLGVATRLQQVDLIAELKKKQVSPQVREGKDGTIEDIITGAPTSTTLLYMSGMKRLDLSG